MLLAGLVGVWSAPPAAFAAASEGRRLEGSLAGGERMSVEVVLKRGEFLRAVVDQRGIDLIVRIEDPRGRVLAVRDGPTGSWGAESVSAVAAEGGSHRVSLEPIDPGRARGGYVIQLSNPRPARREDRRRVAAERVRDAAGRAKSLPEQVSGLEAAAALWGRLGDSREEALALFHLAEPYRLTGAYAKVGEALGRALVAAQAAEDPQIASRVLARIGLFRSLSGSPAEAVGVLEQGLALARAGGDLETENELLRHLSLVAWLQGRYQDSLDLGRQALLLAQALRSRQSEAYSWLGLGISYMVLAEQDRAADAFERAIALFRAVGDGGGESLALTSLASSFWWNGSPQRSLDVLQKVVAVSRASGDRFNEATAWENIAQAEIALGRPEKGLAHCEQSLRLWRASGNQMATRNVLHRMGLAHLAAGRAREAARWFDESMEHSRRAGDRPLQVMNAIARARTDLDLGGLDGALSGIERAIELVESLRGELLEARLKSSFFSSRQDAYAVATDVLMALDRRDPKAGWAARAFQVSERSRARELLESVSQASIDLSEEVSPELRAREASIEARIARARAAFFLGSRPPAERAGELEAAEEERDRFLGDVRRASRRYASLRHPAPLTVEAVQKQLDPETALVSYSISSERIVVFVLTSQSLTVTRLAALPAIVNERVENYVDLIGRASRSRWEAFGGALRADLVEPWRTKLPAGIRRLIFVSEGTLHSLPFEALPAKDGRLLLEDYVVSYAPSATVLGELRNAGEPSGAMLVLANPSLGGRASPAVGPPFAELPPLPNAEAEGRRVARYGGPGTEIRSGSAATAYRIRSQPLSRFGVFHFATHGVLESAPWRSALLLASDSAQRSDGRLTIPDIYRLRLHGGLIVLSACRSARGRILPGEGVQSLAQAFFHAGARSIVASLWDVADLPTARLMEDFYRRLANGEAKADALRGAKLDAFRRDPDLATRFWAAFVLMGEGNGTVPLKKIPFWRRLFG